MKLKRHEILLLALMLGLILFTAGFFLGRETAQNRILVSASPSLSRTLTPLPNTAAPSSHPLDLNTATEEELVDLPGIGPESAKAILSYREEHGRFTVSSELLNISGIGIATYEKLEPLVTISTDPSQKGDTP